MLYDEDEEEGFTITKDNYETLLPRLKDVVAFSYAEEGAMGAAGEINIVNSDGEWFDMNSMNRELTKEDFDRILPAFNQCDFDSYDVTIAEGWTEFNMGMGNHLMVSDSIIEPFRKILDENDIENTSLIYWTYPNIIKAILDQKKG